MKNKKIWMAVGAVAVIAIVAWALSGGKKEETVEFETAKAERQNIHTTITATGTIEPHRYLVSCQSYMSTTIAWSRKGKSSLNSTRRT